MTTLFRKLWENYPSDKKIKAICTNKQSVNDNTPFKNYCAIKLSDALIKSGISLTALPNRKKCWSHSGMKHVLLAEDLANWLDKNNSLIGIGKTEKINPGSFQEKLKERFGIIYFEDYWQRGKETFENRSGDHIDLWGKGRITSGPMWLRAIEEWLVLVSDLNKAKAIWFWEIK